MCTNCQKQFVWMGILLIIYSRQLSIYQNQFYKQLIQIQKMVQRNERAASPFSPPSKNNASLLEIIANDPILSEYFKSHSSKDNYCSLAHSLLLDGLRYRTDSMLKLQQCCCGPIQTNKLLSKTENGGKQNKMCDLGRQQLNERNKSKSTKKQPIAQNEKNNHYNVAFIKHNRFLSPKQKKQLVTPKVTEVIPVKSQPLIIYGKPRVRMDNQHGCPYHNNDEQCMQSIPYGEPCCPIKNQQKIVHQVHVLQSDRAQLMSTKKGQIKQQTNQNELSRYKSTPDLAKQLDKNSPSTQVQFSPGPDDFNKTKKTSKKYENKNNRETNNKQKQTNYQNKMINKPKRIVQQFPGQTIYVDRIVQIEQRVPGKVKVIKSTNKHSKQNEQQEDSLDYQSYLVAKYNNEGKNKNMNKQTNTNTRSIESKIKFLIDRDKNNKAMEKQMRKQQERIKQLQMRINEKDNNKGDKRKLNINQNDILSLSEGSSQMSMMDSKIVRNYKAAGFIKNKNKNKHKKKQQSSGSENEPQIIQKSKDRNEKRTSAYFGTKQQTANAQINIEDYQQELDCSCSKTFDEGSQAQQSPISEQFEASNSSFSDFKA